MNNPAISYGWAKLIGEIALQYAVQKDSNLRGIILRLSNFYGPNQSEDLKRGSIIPVLIRRALEYPNLSPFSIIGSGQETRTYCYISAAIEGFLRVIFFGKAGEAYNIGNNKPEVSVKNIYKILNKINKKNISASYINHPKSYPNDEPQRRCPDITKAIKHLKYIPKVNLEDGLRKFLNWAEKNYKF